MRWGPDGIGRGSTGKNTDQITPLEILVGATGYTHRSGSFVVGRGSGCAWALLLDMPNSRGQHTRGGAQGETLMNKCAECAAVCDNLPITLEYTGQRIGFCSFECVIAHSVNRVCRRIVRRNRRLQRYMQQQTLCENIRARRATKLRLN